MKRNKRILATILCITQILSIQAVVFATEPIKETTANEISVEVTSNEILVW